MIGNHFEMNEQPLVDPVEKEFQYARTHRTIEVERAIDESKMTCTARMQRLELAYERLDVERPCSTIERGQTELAFERTAARSFNVQKALRDIFIRVFR